MPMGMVEYIADFFVSDEMHKVPSCPDDYRQWQQTMYSHFGQSGINFTMAHSGVLH
jgi:hypothetical protein